MCAGTFSSLSGVQDSHHIHNKFENIKIDISQVQMLRILYETRFQLCRSLKIIDEKSINTGQMPLDWKLTSVTSICKKGE